MIRQISRRQMLKQSSQAILAGTLSSSLGYAAATKSTAPQIFGAVVGEEIGAAAGMKILMQGGNAIDAAVAAALTSCAATPAQCGIGGYGGNLVVALTIIDTGGTR